MTHDANSDGFNKVSLVTTSDEATQSRQYKYMYGSEEDPEEINRPPTSQRVQFVSSGEEIASALEDADSLVIVSPESPLDVPKLSPVLQYTTTALQSVVLLSRQDIGKGEEKSGGNFFGKLMGGDNNNFKQSEDKFRSLLKDSSPQASLCTLRCGTLKGGGPGYSSLGGRLEGYETAPEIGLSSTFYKNNFDLSNAMTTISHDKFTLAPMIQKGDPNTMPNGFVKAGMKDSIEASPVETNICTASLVASTLVKLGVEIEEDLEFSLGCEKSEDFPTVKEVEELMKNLM